MPLNWALYFNTLKYLKLFQIYNRLTRRLRYRFQRKLNSTETLCRGAFVIGPIKPPSMIGLNEFRFQNVTDVICDQTDWNALGDSELWRYHLHYFDDLNAENGQI